MKILAIRGRNLASLAGDFEVDFRKEPLASAGLFAITGSTGSGKSTLLDALCLALYEQTPRLQGASSSRGESVPDVGDHGLSPNDPRSLLRRGTGDGYAEVDFIGNDQQSYRARWSVRRARQRADGKLQASEMLFIALPDGQALGDHRKTETLKRIEAAVGLSFEQFTRSVLLAQNDFASFLRASDDERAALLQTLTGTQAFSELSQLAFQRMKDERSKTEQLRQQWSLLHCLSPEQQQVLADRQQTLEVQLQTLGQQQHALTQQVQWFSRRQALEQAVQAEQAQLHQDEQAWEAAASRRVRLRECEIASEARPLLALLERHESHLAQRVQECNELEQQQNRDRAALSEAQSRLNDADAQHQACVQQQREQAPLLSQTAALDQQISRLREQTSDWQQHREQAKQRWLQEQQQLQSLQQQHQSALGHLHTLQENLASQDSWTPIFKNWAVWQHALQQARRYQQLHQQALQSAQQHSDELRSLTQLVSQHSQQQAQWQSALEEAEAQRAHTQAALHTYEVVSLRNELQVCRQRRDQLLQAQQRVVSAEQLHARCQHEHERLQALRKRHSDLAEALKQNESHNPRLETAASSAEQAYRLAQLSASQQVEALRAQLQTDHPCPVCGALDHPYAQQHPFSEAWLAPIEAHWKKEQAAWLQAQTWQAEQRARIEQLQLQADELGAELQSLNAQRDELEHDVQQRCSNLFDKPLPQCLNEAIQQALNDSEHRLQMLEQRLSAYHAAQQADEAALTQLESVRQQLAAAQRSLDTQTHAQQQHEQARQRHVADAANWQQELESQLQTCQAAFSAQTNWPAAFLDNPQPFITQLDARVQQWQADEEAVVRQQTHIQQLQTRLQALSQQLPEREHDYRQWEQRLIPLQQELQQAQTQRLQLLGEQSVDDCQRALETALQRSHVAYQQAQAAYQRAQAQLAGQSASVQSAQQTLSHLRQEHKHSVLKLETWLTAQAPLNPSQPWDRSILLDRLQSTAAEIEQERAALQALEHARQRSQASLATQQRNLQQHLAQQVPREGPDTLQAQLDTLKTEQHSLAEALADVRAERATDRLRQEEALALQARIREQEAHSQVWTQLSDLIGSADGKKFRNFAQQLTLDILLVHANQHLEQLSRRYRLIRNPNSLGLMVIDQEMGEERRSVYSLSGGESFLLSLSLALGLASLSSHRVKVETLFIDEGFGSLDAEALNLAMDALDRLQSSGRKVGVITHVQEMTERISTQIRVRHQAGGMSQLHVQFA